MTRRPGFTLMEIMVTLGILAFGILAILTLFPLAASQMAIAVREDRSAQTAASAEAYLRDYWKVRIVEQGGAAEPFFTALDNPGGGLLQPLPNEPSYPVAIDPMGYFTRPISSLPASSRDWIGDMPVGVARRNLSLVVSNAHALRTCSLMDGLGYDDDGLPAPAPVVDRELRYNWLAVVQRATNRNRYAANLTVVVFDRRPHLYASSGAEALFSASFSPASTNPLNFGSTTVTVSGSPDVKPGGWVMDATVQNGGVGPAAPRALRHANFYQVVSVTPNGANTILELQTPIKAATDNNPATYTGTLVVLRGVSGVYTKQPLSAGE